VAAPVKTRTYQSEVRKQRAARTRRAVLVAARDLFRSRGYAGTSVSDIAAEAGVSVDTVYTSVGRKPQLLLAVIDMTLGGGDAPVAAEDRGYVRAIRAARTAEQKIGAYAEGLREVMPATAPLISALHEGALSDPDCAKVHEHLDDRRAANMRRFAADLRTTGRLRDDLDDVAVADIVWATNSVEYYTLLRARGWSAERYADHLRDLWTRLLLR
jgi:AcrR family transcriptional regulator